MKKMILVGVAMLVVVWAGRSFGQGQPQQQPQPESPAQQRPPDYRDRYGVLVEKNIFLRNRSRPPVRSSTTNPSTSSSRPERRPEQLYTLTGIILEEGRQVAFIENMSTGVTQRLVVGAPIAGGKIVEVDFHYLEFESSSGQRTKVEVGKTLAGGDRSSAMVAGTQPATSESSVPIDPNKPNLTLEERLRLRRQQELRR